MIYLARLLYLSLHGKTKGKWEPIGPLRPSQLSRACDSLQAVPISWRARTRAIVKELGEGGTAVFQRWRQRGFNGRLLFMRTGELHAINFVFIDLPRTPTTLHSAPCPSPSRPL